MCLGTLFSAFQRSVNCLISQTELPRAVPGAQRNGLSESGTGETLSLPESESQDGAEEPPERGWEDLPAALTRAGRGDGASGPPYILVLVQPGPVWQPRSASSRWPRPGLQMISEGDPERKSTQSPRLHTSWAEGARLQAGLTQVKGFKSE